MNKKILEEFAAQIKNLRTLAKNTKQTDIVLAQVFYTKASTLHTCVSAIAHKFNPRFNQSKFDKACRISN